jgi:hypothetical protein
VRHFASSIHLRLKGSRIKHPHHQHKSNGFAGDFPIIETTSSVNAKVAKTHNSQASENPQTRVPPVNSYASLNPAPQIHTSIASEAHLGHMSSRTGRQARSNTRSSSASSERAPLLPSQDNPSNVVLDRVRTDLVPFGGFFTTFFGWFSFLKPKSGVQY